MNIKQLQTVVNQCTDTAFHSYEYALPEYIWLEAMRAQGSAWELLLLQAQGTGLETVNTIQLCCTDYSEDKYNPAARRTYQITWQQ